MVNRCYKKIVKFYCKVFEPLVYSNRNKKGSNDSKKRIHFRMLTFYTGVGFPFIAFTEG